MWEEHIQMGARNEKEQNKTPASHHHRLSPEIQVLNGHRSETQKGHWAVVSMDNAGVHGKGKAFLCQIQDLVWDWRSLWDGFSGTSEDQHFVPLLFHMIRVQHHLQTYLKKM